MLTCSPLPRDAARDELLEALRLNFESDLRTKVPPEPNAHAWGTVAIGDREVSVEIDVLPESHRGGAACPTILLHSEAYEAAFDLQEGRARHHGREALVNFCVTVATSVQAEGFRLEFANDEKIEPLIAERLAADVISNNPGLVSGIATSSPFLSQVRTCWPLADERNGYVVLIFV